MIFSFFDNSRVRNIADFGEILGASLGVFAAGIFNNEVIEPALRQATAIEDGRSVVNDLVDVLVFICLIPPFLIPGAFIGYLISGSIANRYLTSTPEESQVDIHIQTQVPEFEAPMP